jgi:hypothetical protein
MAAAQGVAEINLQNRESERWQMKITNQIPSGCACSGWRATVGRGYGNE